MQKEENNQFIIISLTKENEQLKNKNLIDYSFEYLKKLEIDELKENIVSLKAQINCHKNIIEEKCKIKKL